MNPIATQKRAGQWGKMPHFVPQRQCVAYLYSVLIGQGRAGAPPSSRRREHALATFFKPRIGPAQLSPRQCIAGLLKLRPPSLLDIHLTK